MPSAMSTYRGGASERKPFGPLGSLVGSQSFEPDDVAAVIAAVRAASTPPHAHRGATGLNAGC